MVIEIMKMTITQPGQEEENGSSFAHTEGTG